MAGNDSSPFLEGDLSSFLTEQGRKSTIDERTIFNTPAPLAASTVLRNDIDRKRPQQGQKLIDSFLNITTDSPIAAQGVEDLQLIKFSFSDLDKTDKMTPDQRKLLQAQKVDDKLLMISPAGDTSCRSSLGIIQLEGMEELSSGLMELSPNRSLEVANPVINPLPKNQVNTIKDTEHVFSGGYSSDEEDKPRNQSNMGTVKRLATVQASDTVKKKYDASHVEQSGGNIKSSSLIAPAPVMSMMFGDHDADTSVHEVKIGEDELIKFDEDFSDFEELDDTFTRGDPDSGPANFRRSSTMCANKRPTSLDVADVGEGNQKNVPHQARKCDTTDDAQKTASVQAWDMGTQEVIQNGERRSSRDSMGHFEGEGQESDDQDRKRFGLSQPVVLGSQTALDQRFFRQSRMVHNLGDGEEQDMNKDRFLSSQVSLVFGDGEPYPPPSYPGVRGRGAGIEDSKSETDTEDELDAVRQENSASRSKFTSQRDRVVGDSSDSNDGRSSRPGLEGAGSSEDANSGSLASKSSIGRRETGEGDFVPVPALGSNNKSDDDDSLSGGSTISSTANPRQTSTLDVLRTMGLVDKNNFTRPTQFQEDDPEAQTRIRPMGDDLLEMHSSSGEATHVRFASAIDYRSRSISGAFDIDSASDDGTDNIEELDVNSCLDSQFLAPTSLQQQSLQPSDHAQTSAWVDQSTFNLERAFPDNSQFEMTTERGQVEGQRSETEDTRTPVQAPRRVDEFDRTLTPDNVFENSWRDGAVPISSLGSFGCKSPDDQQMTLHGAAFYNSIDDSTNLKGDPHSEIDFMGIENEAQGAPFAFQNPFDGEEIVENFGAEEFFSDDEGAAMLVADEKEFQEENKFIKDDQMEPKDNTPGSNWSYHSVKDISRPSWLDSNSGQGSDLLRISVGTFMQTRTHALGSLDGEEDSVQRPTFGSNIITPPSNRRPVALIDVSSSRLSNIDEETIKQSDKPTKKSKTSATPATTLFKSNNVSPEGASLSLQDLSTSPEFQTKPDHAVITGSEVFDRNQTPSPQSSGQSTPVGFNSNASTPAAERTGFVNSSAINQYILSCSTSEKPQDLARLIMQMSNDQATKKKAHQQRQIDAANLRQELDRGQSDLLPRDTRVTFAKERSILDEISPKIECPVKSVRDEPRQYVTAGNHNMDHSDSRPVESGRFPAVGPVGNKEDSVSHGLHAAIDGVSSATHSPRGTPSRIPVAKGRHSRLPQAHDKNDNASSRLSNVKEKSSTNIPLGKLEMQHSTKLRPRKLDEQMCSNAYSIKQTSDKKMELTDNYSDTTSNDRITRPVKEPYYGSKGSREVTSAIKEKNNDPAYVRSSNTEQQTNIKRNSLRDTFSSDSAPTSDTAVDHERLARSRVTNTDSTWHQPEERRGRGEGKSFTKENPPSRVTSGGGNAPSLATSSSVYTTGAMSGRTESNVFLKSRTSDQAAVFEQNMHRVQTSRNSSASQRHSFSRQDVLNTLSRSPVTRTDYVDLTENTRGSGEFVDVLIDKHSSQPIVRHIHRQNLKDDNEEKSKKDLSIEHSVNDVPHRERDSNTTHHVNSGNIVRYVHRQAVNQCSDMVETESCGPIANENNNSNNSKKQFEEYAGARPKDRTPPKPDVEEGTRSYDVYVDPRQPGARPKDRTPPKPDVEEGTRSYDVYVDPRQPLSVKGNVPMPVNFHRVHSFEDASQPSQGVTDDSRLSYSFVLPQKHADRLAKMQEEIESDSSSDDFVESVPAVRGAQSDARVLRNQKDDMHDEDPAVWKSPRPSSVTSRQTHESSDSQFKKHASQDENDFFTEGKQSDRRPKETKSTFNEESVLSSTIVDKSPSPRSRSVKSPKSSRSSLKKSKESSFNKSKSPEYRSSYNRSKSPETRSSFNRSKSPVTRSSFNRSKSPETRSSFNRSNSPQSRLSSNKSRSPSSRPSNRSRSPGLRSPHGGETSPKARTSINRSWSPGSRSSKRSSIGIVSPSPHGQSNSRHQTERQSIAETVESEYHTANDINGPMSFGESGHSRNSVQPENYSSVLVNDRFMTPVEGLQMNHHPHRPHSVSSMPGNYLPMRSLHQTYGHTHVVNSDRTPHIYPHQAGYMHSVHTQPTPGIHHAQPAVYMQDYRNYVYSGTSTMPPGSIPTPLQTTLHPYSRTGGALHPNPAMPVPSRVNIITPTDLRFTDVCCVGLSTQTKLKLKNPTSRWVQCILKVTIVRLDGMDLSGSHTNPFTMKDKTIVEPNATEELKVMFLPRNAGVYVAQLEVIPSPVVSDLPLEPDRVPCLITIQAVAEKPNIQIVTATERMLNFDEMPWGCNKRMPITLINKGLAKIPIRMTISASKSSWHCFSFDRDSSPSPNNTSIISHTTRPSLPSVTRSIVNLVLEGRSEANLNTDPSATVQVAFHAPQRFDKGSLSSPPEEHSGRVDIEVDSPSPHSSICCVSLKSVVGSARLHVPRDPEKVILKSKLCEPTTAVLPIRNAGNIPLNVSLCITEWDDQFVVLPSHVKINPDQNAEVVVKFTPKVDGKQEYLSQLLLCIEPNGRTYEVDLYGILEDHDQPVITPPHSGGASLLSNKHQLSWGGVALGKALQQKVLLCNNSRSLMKLHMQIKGNNTHDFQLQSFSEGGNKLSNIRDVILKPREEYPVHIIYSPSKTEVSTAKLQIRPKSENQKYSIPLTGYGGVSNIVLEHLKTGQQGNYWVNMGQLIRDKNAVTQVVVKNNGSRPAYVKTVCFSDSKGRNKLPLNRATVQPSEFCIHGSEIKTVVIAFHPSEREALLCSEKQFMVGTIMFFYGDEIARQRFRRSIRREGVHTCRMAEVEPLASINFDVPYHGEEHIPAEHLLPDTNSDQELFYSTMKTIKMDLMGEPVQSDKTVYAMQPLTLDDSVATIMNDTLAGDAEFMTTRRSPPRVGEMGPPQRVGEMGLPKTPPVKGTPAMSKKFDSGRPTFSVQPDHVILTANRTGEQTIKWIQLTNTSDRKVKYEMSWPAHCISITPEEGFLEPKSTTGACISASSSIFSRALDLPWSGVIHIDCDGQHKELKVQIREDLIADDSLYPSTDKKPLLDQPVTPLVTMTTNDRVSFIGLKLASQELKFSSTKVGEVSETYLHMNNVTKDAVSWMVSSFAPVYVKNGESNEDVYRATYSAFSFTKKVGVLEPSSEAKILVSFIPREKGLYSQFWELQEQSKSAVAATKHTRKIQLSGQGIKTGEDPSEKEGVLVRTGSSLSNTRRRRVSFEDKENKPKRDIVFDDIGNFPTTVVGEKSVYKVIIRNNGKSDEKMEVLAPQRPFHSKPRSFTISQRHYLRLPVEFRPKVAGQHEGVFHIKVTDGPTLKVQLHGQAIE